MTQFNFTTNIEKRMTTTGKVFCIDRMTSDYAEQHPFDVDGFIESVYQEFAGTEFEESRETLRSIWTAVLSVTSPCGDASLYPNKNGAKRAAAIKVWAKSGDYWRRGLRIGDTLPDMVPMTKISRLDDGSWIALFPKDEHLLTTTDSTDETDNIEPARNQGEPRQLDLFACMSETHTDNADSTELLRLQQENERLQAQIAQMQAQQCAERQAREEAERRAEERRKVQQTRRAQSQRRPAPVRRQQQPQAVAAAVEPDENNHAWLKTAGYIAAASVALLVIWQTGLIIPLGLIGLATSGLLK